MSCVWLCPVLWHVVCILVLLSEDGFVRVLCTTETFAVGVNMPSRAVIFNWPRACEFKKFDGHEQRPIRCGEYMQMAGRAGRRGQDSQGNVPSSAWGKFRAFF